MHGLIHVVVKDLIVSRYGEDAWGAVLRELQVTDDAAVLGLKQYDDAITVAAVNAVTKVLAITWDDALRAAGAHFVAYVYTGGHLRMLQSMGDNMKDFVRNLNHIHSHVERMMRGTRAPSFHITDEAEGGFRLSYASVRGSALVALVEGVLPAAAELLHGQAVGMRLEAEPMPGFSATWSVSIGPLGRAQGPPAVADPRGAASRGAAWHAAVMSCFGSCCAGPAGGGGAPEVVRAPSSSSHTPRTSGAPGGHAGPCSEERCLGPGLGRAPKPQAPGALESGLDELARRAKGAVQPADLLMRAVPSNRVCAGWEDSGRLSQAEDFWRSNAGSARHFQLAAPASRAARFISHAWSEPENWRELMGSKCSYAAMKSTELQLAAAEIAADSDCALEDVTFWVDKCCIPQQHSLKDFCISLIEDFLDRCDGMVVLLTWGYFQRLWCVYEWAAFLVLHPPENITVCLEAFLRPSSRQFYVKAIRELSIANCKCSHEPDRSLLKQKVAQYYTSEAGFEELARCSAIALIVRSVLRSASRSLHTWEEEVVPYVELARELRLDDLAEALESADPWEWRRNALEAASIGTDPAGSRGSIAEVREWQPFFDYSIDCWFHDQVVPVLQRIKSIAVRRDFAGVSRSHESLVAARRSSRSSRSSTTARTFSLSSCSSAPGTEHEGSSSWPLSSDRI
ncbi:unnamed protein product [Prorocentrum cordatum]|uniref:Heme NO-binding domain-containing protein n=1 Tax=Prorocentrum cordatum TaxID=2364126 RepID=A0ABN9R4C6_9DINO|nr:unnamed protein product [Polarella glacialis]